MDLKKEKSDLSMPNLTKMSTDNINTYKAYYDINITDNEFSNLILIVLKVIIIMMIQR